MREDLREKEEELTTLTQSHTHTFICRVLKVCVTNSLWVSLFEGQHRGERITQKWEASGKWRFS